MTTTESLCSCPQEVLESQDTLTPTQRSSCAAEVKWARVEETPDPSSCILGPRVSLKLFREENSTESHSEGGAGLVDLGPENLARRKVNECKRKGWCVTKGKSRNGMSRGVIYTTVALVSQDRFLDNPHTLHTISKREAESNCFVLVN